ncbi:MAG: BON domain-containing protein [Gemmatimonas sp.]
MSSNRSNDRDDSSRDGSDRNDGTRNTSSRNDYSRSNNDALGQSSRSGRGGSWSHKDDDDRAPDRSRNVQSKADSELFDRMEEGGSRSNGDMGADSWGGASDRDTGRDRYNSDRDSFRGMRQGSDNVSDRYRGREGGSNQFSSWQNNPSDMDTDSRRGIESQGGTRSASQWGSQSDPQRGQHAGRGPKGYRRDDNRITEDVNEALTRDQHVDASEIEVKVANGEVTLTGTVDSRDAKRHAEDIAERVSGVNDVNNQIKVSRTSNSSSSDNDTGMKTSSSNASGKSSPSASGASTERTGDKRSNS